MMLMMILMLVGIFYAWQGVVMHKQVAVEEAKFHALQADYFNNSKAVRDGAETGSALSGQLVQIENYPSTLHLHLLVPIIPDFLHNRSSIFSYNLHNLGIASLF